MGDKLPVELITTNASSIDRLHDGCRDDIERVIWQHFKGRSAFFLTIAPLRLTRLLSVFSAFRLHC